MSSQSRFEQQGTPEQLYYHSGLQPIPLSKRTFAGMRWPVKQVQHRERGLLNAPSGGAWRTLLRRCRACQWNDHCLRTTSCISTHQTPAEWP